MRPWVLVVAAAFFVAACEELVIGPTDLAVDPAGDRVYVAGGTLTDSIWVVDAGAYHVVRTIPLPGAAALAMAPEGTLYATDLTGQVISVIDPAAGRILRRIELLPSTGGWIRLNGAGTRLYVIGGPDVAVYDPRAGRPIGVLAGLSAAGLASPPWQEDVFLATSRGTVVAVRDATVVSETDLRGASFGAIATDPSGMRVYVADTEVPRVVVVDPYHRRVEAALALPTEASYLAVDATGATLFTAGLGGALAAAALPSGRIRRTRDLAARVSGITVHPSGATIYVLAGEALHVLDASTLGTIEVIRPE